MKTVGIALTYVLGAFLVVRAVVELVTIDYGDSTSYEDDWGGPTLVGVLAVHVLPGLLALALMIWGIRRFRRETVRQSRSRIAERFMDAPDPRCRVSEAACSRCATAGFGSPAA